MKKTFFQSLFFNTMSTSILTCNYYTTVAVKDWKVSDAIKKYRTMEKDKSLAMVLSTMISDLQKLARERKTLQNTIKCEIEKIKDFQSTVEIDQELQYGSERGTFAKLADTWNSHGGVNNISIASSSTLSGTKRKNNQENSTIDMRKDKKQFKFIPAMTPSVSMNKPRLESSDEAILSGIVEIKVNDIIFTQVSECTMDYFNKNVDEQEVNSCLADLPKAKAFLKTALQKELKNLPSWLWAEILEFDKEEKNEDKLIQTMKLVLTDFYATCLRPEPIPPLNERTPFCEHIIPLIKYTNAVYQLLRVQWAEKGIDANKFIGICIPGGGTVPKKMADGIGKGVIDNKERLIIESSG
ncbi:hypothetical protein BDA99DRAFT_498683 [Phascolomyces articulosus]|uniref:Uncharacterized protein n=1 Tax=Phascolomyces articulosus TaxID=60185 RepID=A0AAD5PIC5_9FUNG|nr:hypothetical protein BDA99DRAFT_498683 [Phascolomyces articulosus]